MKWSALKIALISVISLAQILLIVFFLTYKNLNLFLGSWSDQATLTIYLKTDTTEAEKNQILQFLKKVDEENKVVFISRSQAAREFQKTIGSYAAGILNEDELIDLIPETIELWPPQNFSLDEKIELFKKISAALTKFSTVEDSVFGLNWLQKFSKVDNYLKTVGLSAFLILLLAMGFLSALMVRVLIDDSKAEIEVFNLLGATRWSIYKIYLNDLTKTILISLAITFSLTYTLYFFAKAAMTHSEFGGLFSERISFLSFHESVIFIVVVLSFIYLLSINAMISSLKKLSHLTYD